MVPKWLDGAWGRSFIQDRISTSDISIVIRYASVLVQFHISDEKASTLIFHRQVPDNREQYVHQIGRTGRAGTEGAAYTYITASESEKAQMLIDVMKM